MGTFIYVLLIATFLFIGLVEKNAVMCCAAGLFAIAGEIEAKDVKDGDGNG